MSETPTHPLTERFAWLITWFSKRMGDEAYHTADPALASAGYWRFRRLANRFTALIAKWQAGTLPPIRPARAGKATTRVAKPLPPGLQPWRVNWLRRLFPQTAPNLSGDLHYLLFNDPHVAALAAATPQAGRILRPMCRSLGMQLPAYLQLPRRPRRPRPRPAAKPKSPRPIDVTRLPRLAFANLINPEREPMGWRPPNRIGYARPRPPPKRE